MWALTNVSVLFVDAPQLVVLTLLRAFWSLRFLAVVVGVKHSVEMEKAQRPVLIWPSSSPSSQSRASSDSSLQRSITPSPLSLVDLTQVLFQYEHFMDNAKTICLYEGYLTTLFADPWALGHDPVRLQCMSAPINFYVIADSVTSSCIPSCLHLSVLRTRYLQHGLFFCLLCFYRDGSCEDEAPE